MLLIGVEQHNKNFEIILFTHFSVVTKLNILKMKIHNEIYIKDNEIYIKRAL